jgi:hypothetical protein
VQIPGAASKTRNRRVVDALVAHSTRPGSFTLAPVAEAVQQRAGPSAKTYSSRNAAYDLAVVDFCPKIFAAWVLKGPDILSKYRRRSRNRDPVNPITKCEGLVRARNPFTADCGMISLG